LNETNNWASSEEFSSFSVSEELSPRGEPEKKKHTKLDPAPNSARISDTPLSPKHETDSEKHPKIIVEDFPGTPDVHGMAVKKKEHSRTESSMFDSPSTEFRHRGQPDSKPSLRKQETHRPTLLSTSTRHEQEFTAIRHSNQKLMKQQLKDLHLQVAKQNSELARLKLKNRNVEQMKEVSLR